MQWTASELWPTSTCTGKDPKDKTLRRKSECEAQQSGRNSNKAERKGPSRHGPSGRTYLWESW